MKRLIFCLLPLILLVGCSPIKQIPIEIQEKIIYRDSLVYLTDTITVEVPKMVVKEVLPEIDTSYLETSLASSTAYLDTNKRQLHHTLEQKGKVHVKYDTIVSIQYVDRFIEKEVPIITEVEKKHIPSWVWWSVIANVIILCFIAFKIYLKLK